MAVVSIGKAANILGINVRKLAYLCKIGDVKFKTSDKGRKQFDTDNLAIVSDEQDTNNFLMDRGIAYTVKDAAVFISTSVQTIYRLIKAGVLKVMDDDSVKKIYIDGPNLIEYKSTKGQKSTKVVNVESVPDGSIVIPVLANDTHQKDQIVVSIFHTIQDNKIEDAIESIVTAITDSMPDCRQGEEVLSGQKFLDWIKFSILREIEDFFIFEHR